MERVRKLCFDPLLTTKEQIRQRLSTLPAGTAHPFSLERILLCKVDDEIQEIDISSYPEDFFYNAVDLGEMGEVLLRRMAKFHQLAVFNDFQIMQAPASTFRVPISSDKIAILAVSTLEPTYWDFCFADAHCNTCCWLAQTTFPGIRHSGDIVQNRDLLDYVVVNEATLTDKEICVFISGFRVTQITKFLGTHPALMVADHVEKTLYIIPVPLDAATIGDATICCPLVFKRDGDFIVFSILPKATTDKGMYCNSSRLSSLAFEEAVSRADFSMTAALPASAHMPKEDKVELQRNSNSAAAIVSQDSAVFMTSATAIPPHLDVDCSQVIKFDTGLEFASAEPASMPPKNKRSTVLPCIWGTEFQGPMLLATGACPSNVPFQNAGALLEYYERLKTVVFVLNDRMTDNARNLASSYRMNAVFVVQPEEVTRTETRDDIVRCLDSVNINAVTALAGPQSLVLVQLASKFYFYRGIANLQHLNTSLLEFGSEFTPAVQSAGLAALLEPTVKRICNLGDSSNSILLPVSKQSVQPKDLPCLFSAASAVQIQGMEEDIAAAIPQLQVLLNEKDLLTLSHSLVEVLVRKTAEATQPARSAYMDFLAANWDNNDSAVLKKKALLQGELKRVARQAQVTLEPAISRLSGMISFRNTSKRTHDLKRLERQSKIQGNVQAAKEMTFARLAEYLEDYASDMGVMVLNIETNPFQQLLSRLTGAAIDASPCCSLDSRILYLEGLDAGIIMEQSQSSHAGPLRSQSGPMVPIMSMPYLNQGAGNGSMLAWVCWDEFVNLKTPFGTRWMEKCNEAHISALRILMRGTLSSAVVSRDYNINPGAPETGQLMGALLMASMSKLAAMKHSAPSETENAEDTVTKLMRGLFGNLLTVAGSGVRPLSMSWQLVGQAPQLNIPSSDQEWLWYQNMVALYPYTGWPLAQFHQNLQNLLDKVIVRVVTKGEDVANAKRDRIADMARFCRIRNIQLDHCRTIITVLMRMLTEDVDKVACASRLLAYLPATLERQTQSYTQLIRYLGHLSRGGERRRADDAVAASVWTRRSAAFRMLKDQVAKACEGDDWTWIKDSCKAIKKLQQSTAEKWQIPVSALKVQGMNIYDQLIAAEVPAEGVDDRQQTKLHMLTRQALGDAEIQRVPWQVGRSGEFGSDIEPLDEAFVEEMLTGRAPALPCAVATSSAPPALEANPLRAFEESVLDRYKSALQPAFVQSLERQMTSAAACTLMHVPVGTMQVFARALNSDFAWEDLGARFRAVIMGLLENRSSRIESRPGAGGGPQESNVTAFLVRSLEQDWRKGSLVAVDAGVHLSAITRLIDEATPSPTPSPPFTLTSGPFAGLRLPHGTASANAAHVTRALVDTYLITHPHLDHISGFVINTAGLPGTRPKKLAALPSTIQAFKTHIFNNIIWPNLSDENNGAGLLTYLRLVEGGSPALGDGEGKGYLEVCDGLQVKTWSVSHGHCMEKHSHRGSTSSNPPTRYGSHDASSYNYTPRRDAYAISHTQPMSRTHSLVNQSFTSASSPRQSSETERICVYDSCAYFIQEQETRREILIFGDVEPDSVSLSPRNLHIWQEAAPKIVAGTLRGIFIECSYDDSQSNDRLYGHLKPVFVIEELKVLAAEVEVARKLRALESKKRKRVSVSGEARTRRQHSASRKFCAPEDPVSPKSLKPSPRTADAAVKANDGADTPHIATPTEELSLHDTDIGTMTLPPAAALPSHPLRGLRVVIIHVKETLSDGPERGDVILEQLQEYEEEAQLGCEFIISKSGQSFYF
ncbi:Cyclic-AMP phosphodiesterase, class-II [Cordyceps javanica]|uniref:Cyclic-AMP phosphodiesterase, class-II n=1 Tax=Cordyceps javanica TaxID=43265 RepID=A0A545UYB8_9HYPO|nr:Cyclic-AMP phosphodiesterase, class-II [Cordyceps javanica]TQW06304.1 Cyclic-AMP phosphodiesterase, class-II [Cordyceps javanica]